MEINVIKYNKKIYKLYYYIILLFYIKKKNRRIVYFYKIKITIYNVYH